MIKVLDFLLLIAYCGLIYWLSDQSRLPVPELFAVQDKIMHFAAYFVMGVLTWRSIRHFENRAIILALLSIAFSSLYGWSDEWHQSFVAGRSSEFMDWLADTIGAVFAVYLLYRFRDKFRFFS
jgi:VanZ family protein